jgi:capsular polysaccharide biosynthesis protein
MALIELKTRELEEFCKPISVGDFRACMDGNFVLKIIEDRVPHYAPRLTYNTPNDIDLVTARNEFEINGAYHLLSTRRKDTFVAHLLDASIIPQAWCILNNKDEIVFPNSYGMDVKKEDAHRYAEKSSSMVLKRRVYSKDMIEYQSFLDNELPVIEMSDPCILLSSQSSDNIYHWLIESVPRLWVVEQWPELKNVKFIVHSTTDPKVLTIIEKFGISRANLITLGTEARYKFKHLIYSSAIGDMALTEKRFNFLRRIFKLPNQSEAKRVENPKRYYITRKDTAMGRRVVDEDKVISFLSRFGIQELVMSELSLDQLAQTFSEAELLVGPMGSGLINMIYMPPGSAVVELGVRNWGGIFWSMSCGANQEYFVLGSEWDTYFSNRGKRYVYGMPDEMEFDLNKLGSVITSALQSLYISLPNSLSR